MNPCADCCCVSLAWLLDVSEWGGGGLNWEKTAPTGNRMHMALRRMAGYIQEMERKGEEGGISDRSCVLIEKKKSCLEALRDVLLFFPWADKGTEQYVQIFPYL